MEAYDHLPGLRMTEVFLLPPQTTTDLERFHESHYPVLYLLVPLTNESNCFNSDLHFDPSRAFQHHHTLRDLSLV